MLLPIQIFVHVYTQIFSTRGSFNYNIIKFYLQVKIFNIIVQLFSWLEYHVVCLIKINT